jgi:hypothetical protein
MNYEITNDPARPERCEECKFPAALGDPLVIMETDKPILCIHRRCFVHAVFMSRSGTDRAA